MTKTVKRKALRGVVITGQNEAGKNTFVTRTIANATRDSWNGTRYGTVIVDGETREVYRLHRAKYWRFND